jgi:AcrR family transcriptional regulator
MVKKIIEADTETKILETAQEVFFRKGFDGAKMQDIANEAKLNKALLHYYYRSKEKLFHRVFEMAFRSHILPILNILMSEEPIEEKLPVFVDRYLSLLVKLPYLPGFIFTEITRHPEVVRDIVLSDSGVKFNTLKKQLDEGIESGIYHSECSIEHFLMNLLGLMVFPFIAKNMLSMVFGKDKTDFQQLMEQRKTMIPTLMLQWMSV